MEIFITIVFLIPLFFSIVLHEIAHGYVAFRLGDPTAKSLGRLSLNPIRHVSLFGSILLPAFLVFTKSPFLFGWAKPVPVDARHFQSPRVGMAWVAIAGPLTNFAIAIVCAGFLKVVPLSDFFAQLLQTTVAVNLLLAVFNLVPVPPLDGSRIVSALLPEKLASAYAKLENVGLILVVILLAAGLFNYIKIPVFWMFHLLVEDASPSEF